MGGGRFNGGRVALMVAGALVLVTGCAQQPPPHRSDALKRSRALLEQVSALESELHAQNAELDLFHELNERREQATELTCNVSQSHIKEIQRLAEAQKKKRRERRARKVALLHKAEPLVQTASR